MATEMYKGQCQCGAVSITAMLDLAEAMTCDCSRCRRMGFVMAFTKAADAEIGGEEQTTEYLFNKNAISHRFCSVCGVQVYGRGTMPDGTPTVMVNVNCLDGVDLRSLQVCHHQGSKDG